MTITAATVMLIIKAKVKGKRECGWIKVILHGYDFIQSIINY